MFDAFIKIDGVPGESADDKHKDWIEVLSFNHSILQLASASASSAGGASAERTHHHDFEFSKHIDKASAKLHELCSTGKHIKEAVLEVCRAGGGKVKYWEVKLEQVMISHVGSSAVIVSPDDAAAIGNRSAVVPSQFLGGFPRELVHLNYGKIKWTYTQQKRSDGSGGGNVTGGWDLTTNRPH